MSEKRIYLKFFDSIYELKATDSDFDVSEVIEYVEGKVNDFKARHSELPQQKIIVLTLLDMGRDYIMMKKRLEEEKSFLENKAKNLTSKMDMALDFLD